LKIILLVTEIYGLKLIKL